MKCLCEKQHKHIPQLHRSRDQFYHSRSSLLHFLSFYPERTIKFGKKKLKNQTLRQDDRSNRMITRAPCFENLIRRFEQYFQVTLTLEKCYWVSKGQILTKKNMLLRKKIRFNWETWLFCKRGSLWPLLDVPPVISFLQPISELKPFSLISERRS